MHKNIPNANSETKKNIYLLRYLLFLILSFLVFVVVLIILNVPIWSNIGNFGSLLSGVLGPFVTAITGVLLYTSIQEQRNAFIEQTKANDISRSNQAFSIIMNEIFNIEKDRESDLKFLKEVLKKFPSKEDKWEHDSEPKISFDEEGEEQLKGKFMRLKDVDWLRLVALTNRLQLCFRESKKLKDFNDFPFFSIHRIYAINEYRYYMNKISLKLIEVESEDDKHLEDSFRKLFDSLEKYVKIEK